MKTSTAIITALNSLEAVRAEIALGFDNAAEQAEYLASEAFALEELAALGVTEEHPGGYISTKIGGTVFAAWDNGGRPRADTYLPVGTVGHPHGQILASHGGSSPVAALAAAMQAAAA